MPRPASAPGRAKLMRAAEPQPQVREAVAVADQGSPSAANIHAAAAGRRTVRRKNEPPHGHRQLRPGRPPRPHNRTDARPKKRLCAPQSATRLRTRCLPGRSACSTRLTSSARPTCGAGLRTRNVELALGVDDRVRVERELVKRKSATKATLGSSRRTRDGVRDPHRQPQPARIDR